MRSTNQTIAALALVFLTACAHAQTSPPSGPVDPSTGVVKPADGSIPFYPGDLELRSVPSMPRVPKRNPAVNMALWQEELIGRQGAHLFARNDTDKPLRIVKVSIYECTNIEGGCIDYDPNLVLKPGEKERLYTIVPHDKSKTYRYRWRAWGGEERPPVDTTMPSMPRPRPRPAMSSPNVTPAQPTPTPAPSRDATPAPGVDPSGAVSHASGNPLDTQGATITMTATNPGDRSVRSNLTQIPRFRSRRMRLSCDVDAKDVFGRVSVWIQVESPDGSTTAENSEATRIGGTKTGHLSVTTSIPANATAITLGLKLNGTGSVKATAFKFREVLPPRKPTRRPT